MWNWDMSEKASKQRNQPHMHQLRLFTHHPLDATVVIPSRTQSKSQSIVTLLTYPFHTICQCDYTRPFPRCRLQDANGHMSGVLVCIALSTLAPNANDSKHESETPDARPYCFDFTTSFNAPSDNLPINKLLLLPIFTAPVTTNYHPGLFHALDLHLIFLADAIPDQAIHAGDETGCAYKRSPEEIWMSSSW